MTNLAKRAATFLRHQRERKKKKEKKKKEETSFFFWVVLTETSCCCVVRLLSCCGPFGGVCGPVIFDGVDGTFLRWTCVMDSIDTAGIHRLTSLKMRFFYGLVLVLALAAYTARAEAQLSESEVDRPGT